MSLTKVTYSMTEGASANVLDYGADPTGVNNSTDAFEQAIATGKRVRVPAGTYKCNVTINNKTIIEGDGSLATILKPFDDAVAVMTYTNTAQHNPLYRYWDYHSEVRNIGFFSNSAMTGVGFTFGKTNPADYTAGDEYANNVKFYGCYFEGLNKGVQFPFGNIGSEFYSCGFSGNKYGVYTINNKFGGVMHAGNKYFYGGEFHSNTVGLYIHNTADGFGAVSLCRTILESNKIAIYDYTTTVSVVPSLDSVWFEANGVRQGGSSVIDSWSGSTRSDQTVVNSTVILDGVHNQLNMRSCGVVGDIHVKGTASSIVATDCRAEKVIGYGGGPFTIDNRDSSYILLENPYSDAGVGVSPLVTGIGTNRNSIKSDQARAGSTPIQVGVRGAKVANYGPSRAMSSPLTSVATTGNGSIGLTGTVVSDGRIYASCNEFTRAAFGSGEYTRLNSPDSAITTSAGWYVFTLDMKIVSGSLSFHVWNRCTAQFITGVMPPTVGEWYTFAGVAYSAGGQTLYLDFSGRNEDATWRVSAYQIHRFDTQVDAWNFLKSGVFAES